MCRTAHDRNRLASMLGMLNPTTRASVYALDSLIRLSRGKSIAKPLTSIAEEELQSFIPSHPSLPKAGFVAMTKSGNDRSFVAIPKSGSNWSFDGHMPPGDSIVHAEQPLRGRSGLKGKSRIAARLRVSRDSTRGTMDRLRPSVPTNKERPQGSMGRPRASPPTSPHTSPPNSFERPHTSPRTSRPNSSERPRISPHTSLHYSVERLHISSNRPHSSPGSREHKLTFADK
jgi:hypothetical protein